jgi:hypothetical protein
MSDEVHRDVDIEQAHAAMARIGYKPVSGSETEGATDYAERFSDEQVYGFHIGTPDGRTAIALVFAIEAARCMCAISDLDKAPLLLRMAIDAVERPPVQEEPGRRAKPVSELIPKVQQRLKGGPPNIFGSWTYDKENDWIVHGEKGYEVARDDSHDAQALLIDLSKKSWVTAEELGNLVRAMIRAGWVSR